MRRTNHGFHCDKSSIPATFYQGSSKLSLSWGRPLARSGSLATETGPLPVGKEIVKFVLLHNTDNMRKNFANRHVDFVADQSESQAVQLLEYFQ